ncbi:MAG: LapA family protein [Clostridia bacterium]|nr:LapA family protein [Clostridia bacterium]
MFNLIQVYWIVAFIFALIVAVFAIQNAEVVNIRFLRWQFESISLVLVIIGSAAVGAFLFFILGTIKQVTMTLRLKEAEGKIRKLESQLAELQQQQQKEEAATEEQVRDAVE